MVSLALMSLMTPSIYIKRFVRPSFCHVLFVPEDKHFLHTGEGGGQTFPTHTEGGGTNIFDGGIGAFDDVDEEMDVSEASKLSAGARIVRGP